MSYLLSTYLLSITQHNFSGSQHSGTADNEREDDSEDETELRCSVCDQPFVELDK